MTSTTKQMRPNGKGGSCSSSRPKVHIGGVHGEGAASPSVPARDWESAVSSPDRVLGWSPAVN